MEATSRYSLKELNTRRGKLIAELQRLRTECKERQDAARAANDAITACQRKLTETDREIQVASVEPTVTEHAVLRYIERALGINIDEIKAKILTDQTKEKIKALGDGHYPICDGLKAVVKGNYVISVVPS